jgi:hypothetical protein
VCRHPIIVPVVLIFVVLVVRNIFCPRFLLLVIPGGFATLLILGVVFVIVSISHLDIVVLEAGRAGGDLGLDCRFAFSTKIPANGMLDNTV